MIAALYQVIAERRDDTESAENSYTQYLFEAGLNKILKKCAEETGEVLIAAKDGDRAALIEELCDLTYHLLVLMAEQDITPAEVGAVLELRRQKMGNRKPARTAIHGAD